MPRSFLNRIKFSVMKIFKKNNNKLVEHHDKVFTLFIQDLLNGSSKAPVKSDKDNDEPHLFI